MNYYEVLGVSENADISEIKKNSRRYAKRQLTWLRKLENIHWIKYDYTQEELEKLLEIIKK